MLDFLIVLRGEHDRIRGLVEELAAGREPGRRVLVRLDHVVRVHHRMEASVVYPAFRRAWGTEEGRGRVQAHLAEHEEAEALLSELQGMDPGDGAFRERVEDLRVLLFQHMDAEEDGLFDAAYDLFPRRERERMGERVLELRTELEMAGAAALRV